MSHGRTRLHPSTRRSSSRFVSLCLLDDSADVCSPESTKPLIGFPGLRIRPAPSCGPSPCLSLLQNGHDQFGRHFRLSSKRSEVERPRFPIPGPPGKLVPLLPGTRGLYITPVSLSSGHPLRRVTSCNFLKYAN